MIFFSGLCRTALPVAAQCPCSLFQSVADHRHLLALGRHLHARLSAASNLFDRLPLPTSSMMLAAYMMVVLEQPALRRHRRLPSDGCADRALINGLLIVKTKVPDLLATLGMMFLLVGLQRHPD